MQINPISSYSCQSKYMHNPQFHARFTEAQLKEMLHTNTRYGYTKNLEEFIPKLYTLLERFDKLMPGKLAKIELDYEGRYNHNHDLIIVDGDIIHGKMENYNKHEVDYLEEVLIDGFVEYPQYDRTYMPKSVYERKWWDCLESGKTEEDIIKDFSYENYKK